MQETTSLRNLFLELTCPIIESGVTGRFRPREKTAIVMEP
jgi:hypothetical protein